MPDHNTKQKKAKQKPAKPVLEPLSADLGDGDSKFSRALGSTDYLTREQGLTALSRWLTTRTDVSDLEMLRLWKGLYFCFWHSDKVPVQVQA
jgi:ribosomal RNA-processing protein 1